MEPTHSRPRKEKGKPGCLAAPVPNMTQMEMTLETPPVTDQLVESSVLEHGVHGGDAGDVLSSDRLVEGVTLSRNLHPSKVDSRQESG